MKVTVEVDCTSFEARQFLGLPDIQPMQSAVMAEVEKKILAEIDRFSTEGLMKSWVSLGSQSQQQVQDSFTAMFKQGFGASTSPTN
jgi:hypothetical protein